MSLSEKSIKEFQEIYKKEYGKEISTPEATKAAHNLESLVRLLMDEAMKDARRQKRLETEPNGFHLADEEAYCCPICKNDMKGKEIWYDKRGLKCTHCQKALDKRIIPVSVLKNRDCWYSMHDFDHYFGIRCQSVRKLVRTGQLKSRIVHGEGDSIRAEVFLIKDNPEFLPPKPQSYAINNDDGSLSIGYEEVKLCKELDGLRRK